MIKSNIWQIYDVWVAYLRLWSSSLLRNLLLRYLFDFLRFNLLRWFRNYYMLDNVLMISCIHVPIIHIVAQTFDHINRVNSMMVLNRCSIIRVHHKILLCLVLWSSSTLWTAVSLCFGFLDLFSRVTVIIRNFRKHRHTQIRSCLHIIVLLVLRSITINDLDSS